jgi:RNA polymerase sigma-70 factor (ECF subfamily)
MDKKTFELQYEKYNLNLKSFLYRLVTRKEDVEDLAQETYIRALKGLDMFEGRSSFKTWLFSIATNLTKDHYKATRRWPINAQDNCSLSIKASPALQIELMAIYHDDNLGKYDIKEHIDYCFTCVMKYLSIERQLAVMLADIYGFKATEITEILNMTLGVVKHLLFDGRNTMKKVFEQDCSLISKTGVCYKCSELSNSGNSKAETQKKIAALDLAKSAKQSNKESLYELRVKLIRSIDPLNSGSFHLHEYLLQKTDYASDKTYPKTDKVCGDE